MRGAAVGSGALAGVEGDKILTQVSRGVLDLASSALQVGYLRRRENAVSFPQVPPNRVRGIDAPIQVQPTASVPIESPPTTNLVVLNDDTLKEAASLPLNSEVSEDLKPVPAPETHHPEKKAVLNEKYVPTLFKNTLALRAEYAKKNPEHLNRIDKDLNEYRISGVMLGIGSEGFLTDVIMIWTYDIKSNILSFISIPRDLQSPEVYKLTLNPASSRINQAVHEAEIRDPNKRFETVREALENCSGLSIDYLDLMNFDVVIALIARTVGKVPMKIDQDIANRQVFHSIDEAGNRIPDPFYISAGTHEVDGATLLKIVRNRENSSDYVRNYYQQQASEAFLETFFDRALSGNNIVEASRMISAFFYTLMESRLNDRMKSNYELSSVIPDFNALIGVPESLWENFFGSGIKLAERPKIRKLRINDKNYVVPAGIPGVAETKIRGGNLFSNDPRRSYWLTRGPIKDFLTQ